MQEQSRPSRVPPNPKHVRQVFWQIWFPLILALLVILTAAVLVVITSSSGTVRTARLASISIIWMIAPLIVAGMIFVIFTAGMIFLTARLTRVVPVYTRLIQLWVQIFGVRVEDLLNKLADPLIKTQMRAAGWRAFWKHILGK